MSFYHLNKNHIHPLILYSIFLTDIAYEAEIHYTTLMKALPLLEELGMVTMTQQVGNAKLYQINKDDNVVKRLVKFLNELNIRIAEKKFKDS